jgi:hypothetical protein
VQAPLDAEAPTAVTCVCRAAALPAIHPNTSACARPPKYPPVGEAAAAPAA